MFLLSSSISKTGKIMRQFALFNTHQQTESRYLCADYKYV